LFDVGFAGASGDAPVDGFDGVSWFVAAGLDVFDALAEEGAAVCAVAEAVCEAFDRDEELAAVEGWGNGGWRFDRGDWGMGFQEMEASRIWRRTDLGDLPSARDS